MDTYNSRKTGISNISLFFDALFSTGLYVLLVYAYGMCCVHGYRASIAVIGVTYFYVIYQGGTILYNENTRAWQIPALVAGNALKAGILSTLLLYVCDIDVLPFRGMLLFYVLQLIFSSCYRLTLYYMVGRYRSKEEHTRKVVFVGSSANIKELFTMFHAVPSLGYQIVGYFDYEPRADALDKCEYLGTPADVVEWLKKHSEVQVLFCCLPSKDKEQIIPIIHCCVERFVKFYSVPNVRNYVSNRMYLEMVGDVPCFSLYESPLSDYRNKFWKRLFDIFFSLGVLCTVFPILFIVVAIVTKITMPGPIFFRQKRSGLNGRVFYCIKFRSMKVNKDSDSVQATKDDPRTTKWGHLLRKTNLDEIPQFINVLIGDMSIVGPRPHMLKHTQEYSKLISKYMMRHLVKPGITGWSQVTGFRGETKELWQMEGRVKGDIWYIEHWSFGLDMFIIYKTVVSMFKGDKEAY